MDTSEVERPVQEYATLNEFFARRLRPGSRPTFREGCALSPNSCCCMLPDRSICMH